MKENWRQPKFFTDKVKDNKYTAIVQYNSWINCVMVKRFEGDIKLFLNYYPKTEYIFEGWPLLKGQTEEDLLNEEKLKYQ